MLLNKGNGDFGSPPGLFSIIAPYDQLTATNAVGITLADLAHNGKLDAVVTDWDVPIEPLTNGQTFVPPNIDAANMTVDTHGTISVLAGNGDGTFQTEKQYFVGGRPIAVQTADLSGDGKIDIVVVNAFDNQLSILKGNGDRTYQAAISIPLGANPNALAIADLNGDDKPDIAVTNLADNTVSILINQSTPGTIAFAAPVNYSVGTFPAGVVAVDFNHDGKLDLATVNAGYYFAADDSGKHTTLSFLAGNGDGTFAPAVTQTLWSRDGGDAIVAADFGRGEVDLAVANFGTPFPGEVMILKSNGDGTFAPGGKYQVNSGAESIIAADFNREGHPDYALFAPSTYQTAIWYLSGPMFIGAAYGPTLPAGWELVATSDFDDDSYPDYVIYKASTHQTVIGYLNNNIVVGAAFGPTLPAGHTSSPGTR